MATKSRLKANGKTQGKTLKQKPSAKGLNRIQQAVRTSTMPPTGH